MATYPLTDPAELAAPAPVDGPTYAVTLIAAAPIAAFTFGFDAFREQARERTAVFADFTKQPHAALVNLHTTPALGLLPARTDYYVQVWALGKHGNLLACVVHAAGTTPSACLAHLGKLLRDLEQLAVEADPSLGIDADIEAYEALANCAQL